MKIRKKILIIFLTLLVLPLNLFAEMGSDNYVIRGDSISVGGVEQNSENFISYESIGEVGTGDMQSESYILDAGFWAMIGDEDALTFSITDNVADLGTLSRDFARSETAGFTAATTSQAGYVIEFFGNPLGFESNTIDPLSSPGESDPGSEQFGFNLVHNTNPTVGVDPDGGNGQAASGYDQENLYKFSSGDVIAESTQPSVYTDYTASFIGNISGLSDAGDYSTNLTVVITGKF